MKRIVLFLLFALLQNLNAQHSISGNFSPSKDFKWLIAYELNLGNQRYVADTAVNEGYFKIDLPLGTSKGIYRLVYDVPQDEFFIDIIYNGKEDIEFNFNLEEGITFIRSDENKLFNDYFSKISEIENRLVSFYQNGETLESDYLNLTKELRDLQSAFESQQTESLAHQFITSNKPYIPDSYESSDTYLKNKRVHYFDYLDVNNRLLQASDFLSEKISYFTFSALAPELTSKSEIELEINSNLDVVKEKIKKTHEVFQIAVFHQLWKLAHSNELYEVADYIFTSHLKNLAVKNGKTEMVQEIETTQRLRIGGKSPEITWDKNGTTKTLSGIENSDNYILVFWSSTCSHCLKELPSLHKELQKYKNIKVIAIGLEDDEQNWKPESAKLPDFEHAIALGKWESDYAQLFDVQKTPTYFILDKDKRFIAKPEDNKQVISFLRN